MITYFYLVNKTRFEYIYVELRSDDSFTITDIFKYSDWTNCDTISIEPPESVFSKLVFNEEVENGLYHDKKYKDVSQEMFTNYNKYCLKKIILA